MLGLGISVTTGGVSSELWTPASLANLTLWLKVNQNITADQASDNSSITHSTAASNMADGDKINAWNAFGDTSINAVQTTQAIDDRDTAAKCRARGVRLIPMVAESFGC